MVTRKEFLQRRKSGIGGSDVAAVLGLSKWKTPFQLWKEKTEEVELDENEKEPDWLHFGTVLEQVVADEFSARNCLKVERRNAMFRHNAHPELIANIDRKIVGRQSLLECKTANAFAKSKWGEEGTDAIPQHYLLQVQHYMYVTGYQENAFLALLLGGNTYRQYEVVYDSALAEFAAEKCVDFWQRHVVANIPPPPCALDDLNEIYTVDPSKFATANEEISVLISRIKEFAEQRKAAEKLEAYAKTALKLFMQDAETLFSPDGTILATNKREKDSVSDVTDWAAIAEELKIETELIRAHTRYGVVTRKGSTKLTIK